MTTNNQFTDYSIIKIPPHGGIFILFENFKKKVLTPILIHV